MQQRSRREEYSEATRAALVEAARANFARLGYAATPIETVAREARVTRGALYHHFEDKRALIEAGLLRPGPVDMLAHMLTGAIAEAAFMVASSDTPEAAAEEARHLLLGFLASLKP